MIQHVYESAARSAATSVTIATDDTRIAAAVRRFGGQVCITRADHESGTDRLQEVATLLGYPPEAVVVNVQGDEPLLREEHVAAVVRMVRAGWPVATCATPLGSRAALEDPSVVKVARSGEGRALYFSRAGIPHRRDGAPSRDALTRPPFLRHLGLYGYAQAALRAWVALPPSPLEELERLEQLRPLEAGFDIGVAVVDAAEGGVDTPADALHIERRLTELGHAPLAE